MQLRKVGGGRDGLPQERAHQLVFQCQIVLERYIQVTFMDWIGYM